MKEFHQWVSENANSIEDTSEWAKPTLSYELTTELQKRMLLADMFVPVVHTEEDVCDWLCMLCVGLTGRTAGRKLITECYQYEIIGLAKAKEFDNIVSDTRARVWLNQLKKKISSGWMPEDTLKD